MRMSQNDMSTVDSEESIALWCMGLKTIAYVNMTLYMLLFTGFIYWTIEGKAHGSPFEFLIGVFLMLWSMAMCISTSVMNFGVKTQRADYVYPCIIMSIATCFIFMLYMFYIKNPVVTLLLSLCLIHILLTWYPMYVVYKKMLANNAAANHSTPAPSAPIEQQPLSDTVELGYGFRPIANVVHDFRKPLPSYSTLENCLTPPSYESAMGISQ